MVKANRVFLVMAMLIAATSYGQSDSDILDCVDSTVRVQRPTGRSGYTVGSGSIFMEGDDYYGIITNYHVASGSGTSVFVDTWNYGRQNSRISTKVSKSWFTSGKSRDIAIMKIPKTDLPGEMPVIPLAPYGSSEKLEVGQTVFTVGCSNGRWPRLRVGNILKVTDGLIYYEPTSIGGDSGGPVYSADGKTQIGLTAWSIGLNGKTVGLAMTSDRVHDIINGRVSSYDGMLPEGAIPLQDLDLPPHASQVPELVEASDVFWRLPGTDPSLTQDDEDKLPPTPPPADLFKGGGGSSLGNGIVSQIGEMISRFRTRTDDRFDEQTGMIRNIIDSRRQYRIEMERLRQEDLDRQRRWEEEQRDEWSFQNGVIGKTIDQMKWWMKMVGWGVGITTVVAIVAMFFGQSWGAALLWGLGVGIMSFVGMVGRGLGNIMNLITGHGKKKKEEPESKTLEELEAMVEDLKKDRG